jgi:hypothetical protein
MPTAAMRACACGAVVSGRCPACAAKREQQRGTASHRGYGAWWKRFRTAFIALLIGAGVAPVCGAALPDGPRTQDSACRQQGLLTFESADGSSLHFDHEPPLADEERTQRSIVCMPTRIQLLCAACHAAKTARQTPGGTYFVR